MNPVQITGRGLTCAEVAAIADGAPCVLSDDARARMSARAADPDALSTKWRWLTDREPPDDPDARVRVFVLGHCAGVGAPLPADQVRAVLAARVSVLAAGHSGVRPEFADGMLRLLASPPVVPSQGALGAAGSPLLAHLLRVAAGWGGEVWRDGRRVPVEQAVVRPTEKEALAWLNGDTLTAALGALAVHRARRLFAAALDACALSFEACRADLHCIDARALDARGQLGPERVAAALRHRLDGSTLCGAGRKPDPFSVRCAPGVLGAALDALQHVEDIVHRELGAVSDNPLDFDGERIEAGNFHGAPAALALDHLKVALTEIASISERRVFRMTYGQLSGLPSFLVPGTGLNSGLMLAQYTAASLVSECKGLAHPASVDSIPTVQHREDHVPMGPIAARGALRIADAVADVIAIELLCAAQAVDLRVAAGEGDLAPRSEGVRRRIRSVVARWDDDQVLHPDLVALGHLVRGWERSDA